MAKRMAELIASKMFLGSLLDPTLCLIIVHSQRTINQGMMQPLCQKEAYNRKTRAPLIIFILLVHSYPFLAGHKPGDYKISWPVSLTKTLRVLNREDNVEHDTAHQARQHLAVAALSSGT
jgi:hypothetical protein